MKRNISKELEIKMGSGPHGGQTVFKF